MRPLAILDIDGTVAPYGLRRPGNPAKPIGKQIPRLLRILATAFSPVWASSGWTTPQIVVLNQQLGTSFPIIPVPHAGEFGAWDHKPAAILEYAGSYPFAYFDDDPMMPSTPLHLVVPVNGRVGLTGANVHMAKRWAMARLGEPA
jgi:hypothetical protein